MLWCLKVSYLTFSVTYYLLLLIFGKDISCGLYALCNLLFGLIAWQFWPGYAVTAVAYYGIMVLWSYWTRLVIIYLFIYLYDWYLFIYFIYLFECYSLNFCL